LPFEKGFLPFVNGVLPFVKKVLPFEKEVSPFEKGVLAFEKGVLAFVKEVFPFEKGVLAFVKGVLRENNFNVRQLSHAVRHKALGYAFGLRVKVMVLAQCKLFYVKDYSKALCNAILGK
jgi:hypothetical protein